MGNACWIYANVAFRDLLVSDGDVPEPDLDDYDQFRFHDDESSNCSVIATACVELLQVGLDVGSAGIVDEAAVCIHGATDGDKWESIEACLKARAVPSLVAALREFRADENVSWAICRALTCLASCLEGRDACVAAGAMRPLLSLLGDFDESSSFTCDAFGLICNMVQDSVAIADAFISAGAIPIVVAAFRKHWNGCSVIHNFSQALCNLARTRSGITAFLVAGVVPLLAAAYTRNEGFRDGTQAALQQLGFNVRGQRLSSIHY